MAFAVPAVDRRILALCALFGHDVAHHPATETDPGADICHHEGCQSAAIVGLHTAVGLGRQALDVLVCGCPEPGWCSCEIERRRFNFTYAVRWADDLLRHLSAPWSTQAEQILNGQAKAEPVGGMCDLHALIPRPCLWCGEEDG